MTVYEYRQKNPNCEYCKHRCPALHYCLATAKRYSEKTARKCPCYQADKWPSEERVMKVESDISNALMNADHMTKLYNNAINEFAERVKEEFCPDCDYPTIYIKETVDNLVAERQKQK